jgi:hypothetical protein
MNICKDCHSAKLVLCHQDGDIVCTSCGLVQEAHVIDDTLYGNTTYDDNDICITHYERLNTSQDIKYTIKDMFNKASAHILGDEFYNIINDACALYTSVSQLHKGKHNKALCCACFLYACKNINTEVEPSKVYAFFGVRMWMHYSKYIILIEQSMKHSSRQQGCAAQNSSMNNSMLKRMVYDCPHLNQQQAWNVITIATQLYEKIQCLTSNVKMSKMNACLIYISCLINKYDDVSLQFVSKFYNVSIATLKKHEALVQNILKNGGREIVQVL